MTIGGSIFLIAVGAILKFATNLHVAHVNIDTVGIILMIAGAVGFLIGLYQEVVRPRSRREVMYEEREPPSPRY
jgi:hypothetical protein